MTRFLAHTNADTLLADLKANGFEWRNEDGTTRTPEPFEQTTSANGHSAIYLGKIPTTDGETTTYSAEYCANVTDPDATFATEIPAPVTPYNVFA
jgi:hypothetical protein